MASVSGALHDGIRYEFTPDTIEGPEQITGQIRLLPPVEPDEIDARGFIEILGADWVEGLIDIRLTAGEKTTESIRFTFDGETSYLQLLSAPAYYAVYCARSTDPEAAKEVVEQYYSNSRVEWEFRNDCRDTIQFEAFVEVLDALAAFSGEFSHVQFRSGIGYFAKRIREDTLQGIHSFETLQTRIRRWNETVYLKSVNVSEVLGEKLGREWYRSGLTNERQELRRTGFDPTTYDSGWKTVVPACWLSHVVLTDGIEAGKDYVRDRPVPVDDDYNDVKSAAYDANFGKRGPAWGNVVAISVHPTNDDFRYDAYWYLRWTGEEYRGKGKFSPLLFAGATEVAPDHLPPHLKQKVDFEEQYSTGHAWRRDGALEREAVAFGAARAIARGEAEKGYEFKPELAVKAEASLAHAEAKVLGHNGKHDEQISRYDKGIDKIFDVSEKYDVHDEPLDKEVNFLKTRKKEARS